jgi:imidazolonepropionase-like amidohydrolase
MTRLPLNAVTLALCVTLNQGGTRLGAESLVLTGAVVHTVSGPALTPGQVWIRDGVIQQVGEHVEATEARVVDLTGHHLYPGLIAATTILGLTEIGQVRATRDMTEAGQFTPDVQSWIAVNPDSELLPVARANGITHIVPVPDGGVVTGHSGLVALDGWTTERMVIQKPVALHVNWPDMQLEVTPRDQARDKTKWKSPEDLAKERRKSLGELESFFSEAAAYARAREAVPTTPLNPPWEAMRACLRREVPVVVKADDVRQIRAAVAWARTNQLRLVIAGGRDAAQVASLLASNQVPVIFEQVFLRSLRDHEAYDLMFKTPALLHQAGVLTAISVGTGDMAEADVRNLPYHAAQAMAFGLPPDEALRSITLNPARILGFASLLGSLEPGKQATLVATEGDLLDIRSSVRRVWIAGHEVSLETRHTRLYEKYRNRPASR